MPAWPGVSTPSPCWPFQEAQDQQRECAKYGTQGGPHSPDHNGGKALKGEASSLISFIPEGTGEVF